MRVTGGSLASRAIKAPKGDVRPTQDKVRAALFSSLGEFVCGARVLDVFAGSGALGIEAWSRGAAFVCWVEADRRVAATLRQNVETLCRDGGEKQIRQQDAIGFLRSWSGEPFNLILADPPYDKDGSRRTLENMLPLIEERPILAAGGVLVFEQGADEAILTRTGWSIIRDRSYGGTRLLMYGRGLPAGDKEDS